MAKATKRTRKAAKKKVAVKDLPRTHAVKAATARIINKRAIATSIRPIGGDGMGPLMPLATTSGGTVAKAKKKVAKKKTAKPRKAAKKSVAVKDLKAKSTGSKKLGMLAMRRRQA